MELTVTAWRLLHPSGAPAHCLVSRREGLWQVVVWHREAIVLWERCVSDDAALARAEEIWRDLVGRGWFPGLHWFRRGCPACSGHNTVAVQRRFPALQLRCMSCGRQWEGSERAARGDRRAEVRGEGQRDRRLAPSLYNSPHGAEGQVGFQPGQP
jgi:hypothetical protein